MDALARINKVNRIVDAKLDKQGPSGRMFRVPRHAAEVSHRRQGPDFSMYKASSHPVRSRGALKSIHSLNVPEVTRRGLPVQPHQEVLHPEARLPKMTMASLTLRTSRSRHKHIRWRTVPLARL